MLPAHVLEFKYRLLLRFWRTRGLNLSMQETGYLLRVSKRVKRPQGTVNLVFNYWIFASDQGFWDKRKAVYHEELQFKTFKKSCFEPRHEDVMYSLTTDPLVRWARVIRYKPRGIYWPPVQGGSGGGRLRFIFLSRELADVFEKNEKKIKTTSVYRLDVMVRM